LNKIIINCVAVALLAFLSSAAVAEVKLGFINFGQLMEQSVQGQSVRKSLETEFAGRDKELSGSRDAILKLEEKLKNEGTIMSEANRVKLEREILNQKRDHNRLRDEYREDLNIRRNEEVAALQKKVYEVIKEYSEKMNYDLVLTQPVLYASPVVDITDKVLAELNAAK